MCYAHERGPDDVHPPLYSRQYEDIMYAISRNVYPKDVDNY
jgi:hypothetical protein